MSSTSKFVVMGLSMAAMPAVNAQVNPDDLPIINMDTIVVTATQTKEEAFNTAKSIDKVDDEQLKIEQAESVPEAVKELSNVNINQGPRQLSQQVNIRGLSGKEVLQVLDGARQNFQNGHQGSFFLEPELLKEVEVLKGPASSLWGSGAIGGVVNMTTIDPSDFLKDDQTVGATVKGGTDSANDLLYTSDTIYGRAGEKNEYLLNFTYRNTHDMQAGGGETIPDTAYWDRSGMAKWVANMSENQTLRMSYIAFDAYQNVPSDPRQQDNGSKNPLIDQNIYQQNWNAAYEYQDPTNDWIDFSSTLYYNDTEVTDTCLGQCSDNAGGPARDDFTQYKTIGFNAHNSSYLSWSTLTYGAEAYRDSTDGERNGMERDQFPDAHSDVWASYVQAEVPFWEAWTLTPGIRYDHFYNNPQQDSVTTGLIPVTTEISSTTESDFSPSVTLSWQTTDWLSLHAIYDEAFRAPAIDELYPAGYHFGINYFIPNPELKPEKARNKELSARFAFENLLNENDQFLTRISGFYNDIDNLIQQKIISSRETQYVNVPSALIKGIEVDTTYQLEDWFAGISYGFVRGINKDPVKNSSSGVNDQTDYLDDIPPERIIFNLGRYFCQETMMAGVRLTHAWAQDKVSQPQNCEPDSSSPANACPINGYTTLDVYASLEPNGPAWENVRLDFSINNITDQKYYQSTSSLIPEEGRNVRVSLSYAF